MIYKKSKKVVAREIAGEIIIIPLTATNEENILFSVNEIGKVVYEKIDGKKSVDKIVAELSVEFKGDRKKIKKDVINFLRELEEHNIIEVVRKR